uniref:glycosyltransferase family 2 protein n=1 Tax=Paractinoplanes polyasparticus TaxID=2856853 RepID=UPI001C85E8BD|nr:glycosyltransferase family 2 protein [Actinoplanes polyasparticus]
MTPRVSVVIPVYNEGADVVRHLERILREVLLPAEILVVHDMPEDTTVPYAQRIAEHDPRVRTVLNTYGRGPANAIRFGIDAAAAPVAVVTMADGCDDPRQIDDLARLVDRGVVVAAASRYMPGGQQVGGPRFKRMASRWAGRTLWWLARVGTRDATNSFKAYDTGFVREVGIESRTGFEIGIELTAKATRMRRPVAEIPTIWLDRQLGESNFDVGRFVPSYLRWYLFAFGPRLTGEQLADRWAARKPDAVEPGRDAIEPDRDAVEPDRDKESTPQ